jgi:hypothetical protein
MEQFKNYKQYKVLKEQKDAYKVAAEIQENMAIISTTSPSPNYSESQYEGHICVMDVLNKIDSMVRMFERTIKDNPSDKSSQKIVEVISALYDLAQAKLSEAKKQSVSYMRKASGVQIKKPSQTPAVPEYEDTPPESDFGPENGETEEEI